MTSTIWMDPLTLNPYEVLDLPKDADQRDIRNRYRKLALKLHPDKVNDENLKAQRVVEFDRIQQAYELLSDETRRATYDEGVRKADERRKEFLAFALQLYDEKTGSLESTPHDQMPTQAPAPQPVTNIQPPSSIEKEIEERNDLYKTLRGADRSRSPRSTSKPEAKPVKKELLHAVPVDQLNLEILNQERNNALVDIVAVHGLGAIPNITWCERKSGINWLSQETMLPSATPQARILRFGYDSIWMGKTPIRTSLSTIAYKLLLSLNMRRMEDLRPLIFIGHCFGGLVIQRALNLAKMQQNEYPGVFDSSVGIVFLGTPHRGTQSFTRSSALFAAIAASSDVGRKLETEILKSLASEDGGLLDVTDDFVSICTDGRPMITCFFEQRPSKLGKIVGRDDIDEFVVDRKSATLDGHRKYGLESDHFSLNKFDGPNNSNYIQVLAEIRRFYDTALVRVAQSTHASEMQHIAGNATTPALASHQEVAPLSHTPATLSHRSASPDLRHPGHHVPKSNSTPTRAKIRSQPKSKRDNEDEIKKRAMEELRNEEVEKQKLSFGKDMEAQNLEEKRTTERQYLERLRINMVKYGIENSDEILEAFPLPDDTELSQQEINDKDKWHKNLIRGELSAAGLDGGQIDEIINDIGDTMVIDDIETTFTRMAKKWVSTRTLDKYSIPWQEDKDDPSALIIERWVPDYERDFLWDHSEAVRENRGRKPQRERSSRAKAQKESKDQPLKEQKDWFARMIDSFNDASSRKEHGKNYVESLEKLMRTENKSEPHRAVRPEPIRRSSAHYQSGQYRTYDPTPSNSPYNYTPRRSAPIQSPFRRTASNDSIHSAPDYEEVDRRRRNSRALSHSREREPIARRSGELSRRSSRDYHDAAGTRISLRKAAAGLNTPPEKPLRSEAPKSRARSLSPGPAKPPAKPPKKYYYHTPGGATPQEVAEATRPRTRDRDVRPSPRRQDKRPSRPETSRRTAGVTSPVRLPQDRGLPEVVDWISPRGRLKKLENVEQFHSWMDERN
ncbi:hypothetical protein BKA63DRAFT_499273 [Paraphoma chrysanthemicola]|nr:hypothetical protein BKA63DRAFT_499273 [Paraphoma chrysanthemicola]